MDVDNRMEVHQRKRAMEGNAGGYRRRQPDRWALEWVRSYLNGNSFCFTYGDGVADVDVGALIAHHQRESKQAALTAVQPPGRYGALHLDGDAVAVSGKA